MALQEATLFCGKADACCLQTVLACMSGVLGLGLLSAEAAAEIWLYTRVNWAYLAALGAGLPYA